MHANDRSLGTSKTLVFAKSLEKTQSEKKKNQDEEANLQLTGLSITDDANLFQTLDMVEFIEFI